MTGSDPQIPFRSLDWLTPRLFRIFLIGLLLFSGIEFVGLTLAPLFSHNLAPGMHIAQDYESFWSGSKLLHEGKPTAAYDPKQHEAVQDRQEGAVLKRHEGFFYPPVFLMLCWPMALLPFKWSAGVWIAIGFAAYGICVTRRQWLPGLAFPVVLLNALYGQNAFFSAASLGAASLLLDKAPFCAGLALSFMVCKPQLALLIPVFLLAGRRWRAIAGAATGVIGLSLLATIMLGVDIWPVWLAHTKIARHVFENGMMGFTKMTSLFAMLRSVGIPLGVSYGVQAVGTLIAACIVFKTAMKRRDTELEVAYLAACIPLATPFILDYDLVILALPLLAVIRRAETGFLPWEKIGLLFVYLGPVLLKSASGAASFPFSGLEAPLLLLLLGQRSKFASQPPPSAR